MNAQVWAWKQCMSLVQRPCSDARQLKATHALFVTHGIHRNTYALSRLILMAAVDDGGDSSQFLPYASLLFHHSETPPNSFIYNTLIRAHSRSSQPHRALFYFHLMQQQQQRQHRHSGEEEAVVAVPDHHTFPFVLLACTSLPSPSPGQQVHALVFKNGLASADHFVQTALLRFYVWFSDDVLDGAQKLFEEIPRRDAAHFDVLMNGYLRRGLASKALHLFQNLLLSGVEPDEFILTTALAACAHVGALDQGIWIHNFLKKMKNNELLINDPYVSTTLVSMYSKCGCIGEATRVFDEMPKRNTFSWATMISGFATHGLAREAIGCLHRMQVEDGLRPDGVIVLGVLSACAHAGLVEEGRLLLAQMETSYGVVPQHEHHSCTVDLLCRVGQLEEAVELVGKMPMRPLASVWGSLLTGCKTHGNVELAELAVEQILRMEPALGDRDVDGVYVQLSNIYMTANRHEDARKIRKLMGGRGIKKKPGCSVIEVDGVVSSFVAGDQGHPLRLRIYEILDLLHVESSTALSR